MIIDFRDYDSAEPIRADICIVGGGAAGITLARALAATGKRLCLLESGGREPDLDTQELHNASSVGFSGGEGCRLRYFGGTTNHWASWSMPISPWAMEQRDWVPNSGWPFGREELDPWYRQAHDVLDLGEFVYDKAGLFGDRDVPELPPELQYVFFRIASQPVRFGQKYAAELEQADNIAAYLYANLVHLDASSDGGHIRSARIQSLTGQTTEVIADTFILACGAWENARLLLLSNDVNPNGLGNDHDVVGRYLMQHPHAVTDTRVVFPDPGSKDVEFVLKRYQQGTVKFRPAFAPVYAVQKEQALLDSMVMLARDGSSAVPDERNWFAQQLGAVTDWWATDPERPAPVDSRLFAEAAIGVMVEQAPDPESRLTLGQRIDALGQREALIDWRISEQHNHTVRTVVNMVGSALTAAGVGRVRGIDQSYDYRKLPGGPWGGCHHMGTTRMGTDPRVSVVDSDSRVHGIDNLYIAGSSVFPAVGFANPTMTLVALSLRLAAHLGSRKS